MSAALAPIHNHRRPAPLADLPTDAASAFDALKGMFAALALSALEALRAVRFEPAADSWNCTDACRNAQDPYGILQTRRSYDAL